MKLKLALSLGLLSGSLASSAFAQFPTNTNTAMPAEPVREVIANPFPAARDVTTIAPTASEILTEQRILMAPKFWANVDYQVLYTQNANTPTLIQVVPNQFVAQGNRPTTTENFFPGGKDLKYRAMSGFKVSAGMRIQPEFGVDGTIFWTETLVRTGFLAGTGAADSAGIARPYIQAATGNAISLYSALPGQYAGFVSVKTDIQAGGADINLRKDGYHFFVDRSEWLGGFRYFELSERTQITDRSTIAGTVFNTLDEFQSRNQFYGGQIGVHSRIYGVKWSLDFINKFGIGGVQQQVRAFGSNTITANGVVDSENGGLYAREGNIGLFERNKFAVMGESQVIAGYNVTENIRLHLGYTGTWISSAIRASEVIDPNVNDSRVRFIAQPQASNANTPTFRWNRASDFFLQGLTFGATIGY